ncbi:glycosyltransferase [Ruminococcus flavefaciens]|uniref:glycosyltransferase n=1 Tax=Ruminococcus flavefaciens TaxID=1265 RepID=UPI000463933B|nr:nucleotide disphospho-sugar-binding domain-containing protein [Ruminococcus flavefaciens]
MRLLIVPMAAMAETSGPFSRCRLLAESAAAAGIDAATCIAKDVNYSEINGIKNYFLDVPSPFGMPEIIASKVFPVAQKFGITSRKTVKSFDEVLWFTGNSVYSYLVKSIASVRGAIRNFKPDIVYSEFSIPAIIAAKLEKKKLFTTVSYPTQPEYANAPKLARGVNRYLQEKGLPQVNSVLELFDWADEGFCPSIHELEPIKKENVAFCGALKKVSTSEHLRNKIVVYMGNGTVSASMTEKEISKAFIDSEYEVYIASKYLKAKNKGNIHIAPRWDFNELLDEAVLYINHGGQNSVVDGMLHGVSQMIVPGKVFERRYNAVSIAKNKAGIIISHRQFKADIIRSKADKVIASEMLRRKATELGKKLSSQGGVDIIIKHIIKYDR